MAFTEFETDTANISKLSDRPNQNDGLSSAQLKGRFDKAGNDIKTYINDVLLEELERTTDGDSGADNIGATAVGDGTATTVQGILEELDGAVVHKTGNETIDDVKTFTSSPVVPTPTANTHPATKKYVNDTDATAVHKTGDETITGTKTFSTPPVIPTPTTDTNPATKKYVDDTVNSHVTNTNNPHGVTAEQVGAVPTTRTVNGKALSSNITLTPTDVSAVATASIVDNLTTNDSTKVLSAKQGKVLEDGKIAKTAITNTLTETAEGKVLDARQGKVLKDLVDTNTQFTDVDNVVYSWRFIKSAEGHMQLEYTEVI